MDMYVERSDFKSSIDGAIASPPRPEQKHYHRQSSSHSIISNASSRRSHRRSYVEVGSMIFNDPSSVLAATTIPIQRQKSEPIKRSIDIHRFSHRENRAPDEDSKASSCARVLVSKDSDTICCTSYNQDDDDTERALDLIKKLSFETGDVSNSNTKKPSASVCSAPTVFNPPVFLMTHLAERRNNVPEHQNDEDFRPESPPLRLPPKIQRMEDSHSVISLPDHVPQVMHNRNRLRSTSISEMSDSYRLGFDNQNDDTADAHSLHSFDSYSSKSIKDAGLNTIENAVSPPLHPGRLTPVPPLMNRGRTSTMTSDHSSFLSSSSSSNDDLPDEYSISTYEDELRGLDDPPGYYDGDFISLPGHWPNAMNGCANRTHISWDHNASHHLSSEVLQQWDKLCEEEEIHLGVANKQQHILRALSCPDIKALANDDTSKLDKQIHGETHQMVVQTETSLEDEEIQVAVSPDALPHLMAHDLPPSHAPSRSIFSYTNSYSPSTISSGLSDHMDEISHLDFDMTILYPREIEVINSPNTTDTVALQRKRLHRRSRSSMGLSKPLHKKNLMTTRKHRRNKSDNILVDQVTDPDATPPTKHRKLISLSNIIEDVKSLSSASAANSSDQNLLNVLSLSLGSEELNVSSMKETIAKVWDVHGEKVCWFTIGCCFATSVQYFVRL